jgi:hypothetical protein
MQQNVKKARTVIPISLARDGYRDSGPVRIKRGAGVAKATAPLTMYFPVADAEVVVRDAEPSCGLELKFMNVTESDQPRLSLLLR